MATISFSIPQNLSVAGTLTAQASLVASATTSSLLRVTAAGLVATTTLTNLSLDSGTGALSVSATLAGINSVTSTALSPLVLATGTSGTALSFASATNIATFSAGIVGTSTTLSSLTAGRVIFAGTSGLLADDADFTFATDTLTVTKATIGGISHIANAITSANSVASAALSTLTLGTGTFGVAVTFASATGIPTFAAGAVFAGALSGITTLGASGVVTLTNATEASAGAGALVVTGGVATGKAVYIGSTTASSSTTTGAFQCAGGAGIAGALYVGGALDVTSTIAVAGNSAFGGNSFAGARTSTLSNTSTTHGHYAKYAVANSSSELVIAYLSTGWAGTFLTSGPTTPQAAIYSTANVPIVFGINSTYVAQVTSTGVTVASTTASTSTTTGALIVSGGAGIAGAVYIGGVLNCTSAVLTTPNIGAATGTSLALSGAVTASGTGTHTFGTTNTVAMAAGVLTATSNGLFGGATAGTYSGTNTTLGVKGNTTAAVGIVKAQSQGTANATAIEMFAADGVAKTGHYVSSASTNYQVLVGGVTALELAHTTGNAALAGNLTVSGTGTSTFSSTSSILALAGTTASTSTTTGALVVSGGVGIAGSVHASAFNVTYSGASNANALTIAQANAGGNSALSSALIYVTNAGNNPFFNFGNAFYMTAAGNVTLTGMLSKTGAAATGNQWLSVTGTTTAYSYAAIQNTGAYLNFGIESSVGGAVLAGSAAYSSYIGSFTNTSFYIAANSAIVATFAGTATTLAGNLTVSGTGTSSFSSTSSILSLAGTTASTSTTTGALVVAGGVGVAGAVWAANYATTQSVLTYAASVALDLTGASGLQTLALTGAITFTTSNLATGRGKVLVITCDGTGRAFTFPAGWVFVGAAAPASIAANKTAVLSITSTTGADSGVIASYAVQP